MVLTIPDVNPAVAIDKNAMGPSQATLQRIPIGSVMHGAVPGHGRDQPRPEIDTPDGMTFGVSDINAAIGTDIDPFRSRQFRGFRGTALA
jgi:hypothetical protein